MQVHDELASECDKQNSEEARHEIREWMEHPFPFDLDVPLGVDINIGSNWAAAK
jgi:DNA polymerase I-like protein with 3'-5' exonuclease and polymerase domains